MNIKQTMSLPGLRT